MDGQKKWLDSLDSCEEGESASALKLNRGTQLVVFPA